MNDEERRPGVPGVPGASGASGAPDGPGDLEYDEAHDGRTASGPERERPHEPVQVATETADQGGDYAYDLAHDVPRSGS